MVRIGSQNHLEKESWTVMLSGWDNSVVWVFQGCKLLLASCRPAHFLLTRCQVIRVSAAWKLMAGWQDVVTVTYQEDTQRAMKQL